jgi:hypothetical protein
MDNEVESSLANRDYDKAITGFSKLELKVRVEFLRSSFSLPDDHLRTFMQEEQNSSSTLGPYFYTMYLLVYLIKGDLSNAKYLWKRAPVYLKAATSGSFLSEVWEVAKALWVEDVTTALTKVGSVSWPAEVQTLANELRESIVESELRAVGSAYEQIGVAQLAGKLCMSEQQLVQCK